MKQDILRDVLVDSFDSDRMIDDFKMSYSISRASQKHKPHNTDGMSVYEDW